MSGLVLELQADALNRKVAVSDLLRKTLVVTRKLGVSHMTGWLTDELNGYGPEAEVPHYREVRGQVKVWNPYHGWQPVNFGDTEMAEKLSTRKIMQPVGELDSLNTKQDGGYLQIPFPQHVVNSLMSAMNVPLQPTLIVPPSEVIGLLDAVRNHVLDFALQLEQEGVIGEGMSFSTEEKRTASHITYNVTNNIGSMQNSQLQQHSSGSQTLQTNYDVQAIADLVKEIGSSVHLLRIGRDLEGELLAEIATVESQAASPRPKKGIVSESLKTIRNILEGASGSVLATGFLTELGKFI